MDQQAVRKFFKTLQAANPHPQSELEYVNPFTLLVAVVLSAQSTDKGVNKATKSLFQSHQTPESFVNLGEEKLREAIKTIGLYKTKAANIIKLSKIVVDQYDSKVPSTREALESLPGVGRKTANVVLNVAFGQPTLAVDTHIFRVCNRTGLAPGSTPRAVEESLEVALPETYKLHAHHWLILLGRYTCKARKPECWHCPVREWCMYEGKTEK
ncbi:MAG: endonuclease III [Alphaproteobacteria bacterium]|nr:endonuclease III [Alphaproteobacteria bacterium]